MYSWNSKLNSRNSKLNSRISLRRKKEELQNSNDFTNSFFYYLRRIINDESVDIDGLKVGVITTPNDCLNPVLNRNFILIEQLK